MFKLDQYASIPYRNDIQGLRAIGALTIMVFHIWMNKVSGGVDIFIVVSGYLLTAVYIGNIKKYAYKGIGVFLINIFKRIYIAAVLVIAVTAVAVIFVFPGSEHNTLLKEAIASMLQLENIQLIRKSTDYLSNQDSPSPFQQFWALSVQVQFYLIMALLLWPVFLWSIRRNDLKPVVIMYVILMLASFVYAHYAVQVNPSKAYFNTFARLWEFIAGGLVYLFIPVINFNKKNSDGMGLVGLALIFVAAIFLPANAPYPAYPALVPVLAAVLILIAGHQGNSKSVHLLSLKPLVIIGGFAFTLYLGHWPILVLYKQYYLIEQVSFVAGMTIILVSIALAYATYIWWEKLFDNITKRRISYNMAAAAGFIMAGLLISVMALKVSDNKLASGIDKVLLKYKNKEYSELLFTSNENSAKIKIPYSELKVSRSILPQVYHNSQCHQDPIKSEATSCTRVDGDDNSIKLLVVGSSHIVQWLPALEKIALEKNFRLDVMTKSGCPLGITEDLSASCRQWNKNVIDKVAAINPDFIITNSTRTFADKPEIVTPGLIATLESFKEQGIAVLGVRDNPRYPFEATDCAMKNYTEKAYHDKCSMPRDDAYSVVDPALEYKHLISSMDMSKAYCSLEKCYTAYDDNLIYRDKDHIGVPYVYTLQKKLETKLMALVERADAGDFSASTTP